MATASALLAQEEDGGGNAALWGLLGLLGLLGLIPPRREEGDRDHRLPGTEHRHVNTIGSMDSTDNMNSTDSVHTAAAPGRGATAPAHSADHFSHRPYE